MTTYFTGPNPLDIVKWRGDTEKADGTLPVSLHGAEH
jgi:hypothetical protein